MSRSTKVGGKYGPRTAWVSAALGAGFALALVAGIAIAKAPSTLRVAHSVHVTNTPTKAFRVKAVDTHEAVAVGTMGFAVYTFQGETTHHLICKRTSSAATNCWAFWPPVTVNSAKGLSAQKGIKGKLGTFRNHGLRQVTLGGSPLYYFTPDLQAKNKKMATGDELKTFGSIWHVVKVSAASPHHTTTHTSTTGTTSTSTSSTSAYPYPY
jgi:predicted lipoprotein with Yx(FWY)xxD motif